MVKRGLLRCRVIILSKFLKGATSAKKTSHLRKCSIFLVLYNAEVDPLSTRYFIGHMNCAFSRLEVFLGRLFFHDHKPVVRVFFTIFQMVDGLFRGSNLHALYFFENRLCSLKMSVAMSSVVLSSHYRATCSVQLFQDFAADIAILPFSPFVVPCIAVSSFVSPICGDYINKANITLLSLSPPPSPIPAYPSPFLVFPSLPLYSFLIPLVFLHSNYLVHALFIVLRNGTL